MPLPLTFESSSRRKTNLSSYVVNVSDVPVQVSGSIIDPKTGFLSNGVLTALGAAPSYFRTDTSIGDPTVIIYVGRTSSVSSTDYDELLAPGDNPLVYNVNGSYTLWVVGASNGTCVVSEAQ